MIQSDKFDSLFMEIKKILENTSNFLIKRFIEVFGLFISILSTLLLIALLSYSPEDPNFIFPDNTKIENILGFRGSLVADLFFQSIGLVSILISITFFFYRWQHYQNKKIITYIAKFFLFSFVLYCRIFISHNLLSRVFLVINKWQWRVYWTIIK